MHIRTNRLAAWLGLWVATILMSACGGGGGSTETLYVDLTYPVDAMQGEINSPMSASPIFTGLNGHTPHCNLGTGTLPAGVGLANNCVVSGTPSSAGNYAFTVHVTADGVQGSLDFPMGIVVTDPTPILNLIAWGSGFGVTGSDIQLQLPINIQSPPRELVSLYKPIAPGDTLSYAMTGGTLPAGISFDTNSAAVSGTPTVPGYSSLSITATLTHRGRVYVSAPVTSGVYVMPTLATFAMSGCPNQPNRATEIKWMVPVQCDLTVSNLDPGARSSVSVIGVPAGLTFDPATARLTGQLQNTDLQYMGVQMDVTLADGRSYSLRPIVEWYSVAPQATWNDASGVFANMSGVLRGGWREPQVSGITGMVWVKEAQAITIDPGQIPDAMAGDTFSYALVAVPGATLPAWLTIDAASGRITGLPPKAPGSYQDVQVRLTTLRQGLSGSALFTWRMFLE